MTSNTPQLSSSSLPPLMMSAIPPPGLVSVNTLDSVPVAVPASVGKSNCSTSVNALSGDICENHPSSPIPASEDQSHLPAEVSASTISAPAQSAIQFVNLPVEIHEIILDHIFGKRASAGSHTAHGESSAQNWSKALHHPRRKALSDLALTCRVWTGLVQSRIYRHIRIKGNRDELAHCVRWFKRNPHLIPHVCHIEIWMPIWGDRVLRPIISRLDAEQHVARTAAGHAVPTQWDHDHHRGNEMFYYHCATNNASLEEIFGVIRRFFPAARVLTLEGGHCKNPPMVQHFRHSRGMYNLQALIQQRLPVLEHIQTFIMRGAWNLMRQLDD